jgi:hypothetical protein
LLSWDCYMLAFGTSCTLATLLLYKYPYNTTFDADNIHLRYMYLTNP